MVDRTGPLIVRHPPLSPAGPAVPKDAAQPRPGLHSHNRTRRMQVPVSTSRGFLSWFRTALLLVGLLAVGYYCYSVGNEYVYQVYENWAFDQQIAGRKVAFADYVREQTPAAFLVGTKTPEPAPVKNPVAPENGALLGRVKIDRLNLSAMVREGVDAKTLSLAVGHVPSTALPGEAGNFAIAAHRDTLFRALKDIRQDDLVTFQSPEGTYTYKVVATEIVKPSDVRVLQPNGGGLIPAASSKIPEKLLTMITCYPFYYVGSAPKRFIVEARFVSSDIDTKLPSDQAQNTSPPAVPVKPMQTSVVKEPRVLRGSSGPKDRFARHQQTKLISTSHPRKKRGFWHRMLHL
jgi:sortase A